MMNERGFTLLETLIYISLFAIVIGGGMVAVYNIIQTTEANYNHVILQEEANFLFRKIEWALVGATSVTASGSTLVVTRPIIGNLTFTQSSNTITLQRGAGPVVILNSSSVPLTTLSFTRVVGVNGKPDKITSNFSLITAQNGRGASQDFSFTKYLRN